MEDCFVKRMLPVLLIGAALLGYLLGYASKPSLQPGPQTVMTGHFDDLSMIPSANAQENKPVVMPFNFNSPREPQLAPDARPSPIGISMTFEKRTTRWRRRPRNC